MFKNLFKSFRICRHVQSSRSLNHEIGKFSKDSSDKSQSSKRKKIEFKIEFFPDGDSEEQKKSENKQSEPKIRFDDVVGMDAVKTEIMEFLDIIRSSDKYIRLGAKLPKGALLSGPPGTGKTYVIKALASECDVPFFYFSGTDFEKMIVGQGSMKLRNLFADAAKKAPSIIFIDEIDTIGRKRSTSRFSDSEQTLNQLLVEMDGIVVNSGVIMFGATNRPDILDKALVRPGRFDRTIYVSLPVLSERIQLFNYYLSKVKCDESLQLDLLSEKLASATSGMSAADISNVCNEAAIMAVRTHLPHITDSCFHSALERVQSGIEKKNVVFSKFERRVIAYNEAGKTLVSWMLPRLETVQKLSIIPRSNANQTLGGIDIIQKERFLYNMHYLKDKLTYLLAGRACESVLAGLLTTKAERDLEKVKDLALSMVQEWGMSEKVGHVSFQALDASKNQFVKGLIPYSAMTKNLIDMEANELIKEAYKRAETIIKDNKQLVEKLVDSLLEKEFLVTEDIEKILGPKSTEES